MPNGSEISQQTTNSTQQQIFYVSRRNQTVELNYANFSDYDVPTGIYHCEIMDDNNVTNHFFVGIYPQNEGWPILLNNTQYSLYTITIHSIHPAGNTSITSLIYETKTQTFVCTSTGGPATNVVWSKNNIIVDDRWTYEHSKIIIDRTSATYESRLKIVDKSSKAAGNYTCMVSNSRGSTQKSLHLEGKLLVWYNCRYSTTM